MLFENKIVPFSGLLKSNPGVKVPAVLIFSVLTVNFWLILSLMLWKYLPAERLYASFGLVFAGALVFAACLSWLYGFVKAGRRAIVFPLPHLVMALMMVLLGYLLVPAEIRLFAAPSQVQWAAALLAVAGVIIAELLGAFLTVLFIYFIRSQALGRAENQFDFEEMVLIGNLNSRLQEIRRYGGKLTLTLVEVRGGINEKELGLHVFERLKKTVRTVDVIGRLDRGDRIAVISGTDHAEADKACRRLTADLKKDTLINRAVEIEGLTIRMGAFSLQNLDDAHADVMKRKAMEAVVLVKPDEGFFIL